MLRRDAALDPNEAFASNRAARAIARIDVRKNRSDQLRRFILVDDAAGLGENRHHLHVGRQNFAVAIENVGARAGERLHRGATNTLRIRLETEIDQPHVDCREKANEAKRDQADTGAALVEIGREQVFEKALHGV